MTVRDRYLRRTYGVTESWYNRQLKKQKGVCWFCGRSPKTRRLHVDHNHKTGRVRGLLCYFCNRRVVGRHNLQTATKLYEYMRTFEGE